MSGDIIPIHPFHSHPAFLIPFFWLWPNLSGCSSPPGKNQCPRSLTLDPERVRGRTLPKSSLAQKPSKSWPWPVPLGKSEATINVCTFPGSLPRCDATRDTHTHLHPRKAKKNFGGLSIHDGCTLYYFFSASSLSNLRSKTSSSEIEIERSVQYCGNLARTSQHNFQRPTHSIRHLRRFPSIISSRNVTAGKLL